MISTKNIALLLFSIALLSCTSLQHTLKKENKFSVIMGDCFDNDTVSIYANDSLLFLDRVLKSDFSTGSVFNTSILYDNGYIIAEYDSLRKKVRLQIDDELRLRINLNSKSNSFSLPLKKGRVMVIDACQSEIKVNQYKKEVTFE